MPSFELPALPLDEWQDTRKTIHAYSKVLGAVRGGLAPRQKHSAHRSLRAAAAGLTTTPIPYGPLTFEMLLDFTTHQLEMRSSHGARWQAPLGGQSPAVFCEQVRTGLARMEVEQPVDMDVCEEGEPGAYDTAAVARFWLALAQIDGALKRFRGEQRQETGDVQVWPHGFDLAMLWFSGRRVPGTDHNVPRDSDEQMNFGFSTGDAGIPEPYFYATAWPRPEGLAETAWPEEVVWHNQGWQGAVLRYAALVGAGDAEERLLNYWRTFQKAGESLMQ